MYWDPPRGGSHCAYCFIFIVSLIFVGKAGLVSDSDAVARELVWGPPTSPFESFSKSRWATVLCEPISIKCCADMLMCRTTETDLKSYKIWKTPRRTPKFIHLNFFVVCQQVRVQPAFIRFHVESEGSRRPTWNLKDRDRRN